MRLSTAAFIAAFAFLGVPLTAHADCPLFPADGQACAASKATPRPDLAKLVAAKAQAEAQLARAQLGMAASVPGDCKMVKPIDPRFVSKMPVQTPDPAIKLPIKIVPAPSCEKRDSADPR